MSKIQLVIRGGLCPRRAAAFGRHLFPVDDEWGAVMISTALYS
jgi:hypothetical protein